MKRSYLAAAAAILSAFSAQALEIGKPTPEFQVTDTDGREQSLAAHKGKIIVMEWNNPRMPFVHKHYDSNNMQQLQAYATGKDVVWLSVNSSAEGKEGYLKTEEAKVFVERAKRIPAHIFLTPTGKLGKLYGAKTTPHMFVIDKAGNLAYEGAIDDHPSPSAEDIKDSKNYVKAAIDALLEGKPVETAQTRAYGCSVKYAD